MRYMKIRKGFTLVEIIVSLAIISIIFLALASAFSNGLINLYSSGNKTKAVEKAQGYMDSVWLAAQNGGINVLTLDNDLKNLLGVSNYSAPGTLYQSGTGDMKFHYSSVTIDSQNYTKLTIVVFYQNKAKNVAITSIIPVGGM